MDTLKNWSRVFDFRILPDGGMRWDHGQAGQAAHFWDFPGFVFGRNGSDPRNQLYFGMVSNWGAFPGTGRNGSGAAFHKLEPAFDVLSNLNQDHHLVITGKLGSQAAGDPSVELWEVWLNGDRLGFFTPPLGSFPHGIFNHNGIGGSGSGMGTHDGSISLLQIYRGPLADRSIYQLYANPKRRSWVDRKCTTSAATGGAGGAANEQPPGSSCTFPFEWRNVTYSTCTSVDSLHGPWCATTRWTESWGWGFCDPDSCSAEMTQTDEVLFGEQLQFSWDFKTPGRSVARGGRGEVQPRCDPCNGTPTPHVKPVYGHFLHGRPTWTVSPPKLAPTTYIELNKGERTWGDVAKIEIDYSGPDPLYVPQNVTFEAVFRHAKFESWSRVFDIRNTPEPGSPRAAQPFYTWDGFKLFRYNESRNNELAFSVKNGANGWGGYAPPLGTFPTRLGQWHHAVITGEVGGYDGHGFHATWCMWVDGVQLGCQRGMPAPAQASYDRVAIGGTFGDQGDVQSGDIDFVRIYDKALTDAEVSTLFLNCNDRMWASQCPPVSDRVLHWWDFTTPSEIGAEVVNFGCACNGSYVRQQRARMNVSCAATIAQSPTCPAGTLLGAAVWTVEQKADKLDGVTKHHLTLQGARNNLTLMRDHRGLAVGSVGNNETNSLAIELVFKRVHNEFTEASVFQASTADSSATITLGTLRGGGLSLQFVSGASSTAVMTPVDFSTVQGQWHHVIVVGRASGQWEFWVDGSLRSTSHRAFARCPHVATACAAAQDPSGNPITMVESLAIPPGTTFSSVVVGGGVWPNAFEGDLGLVAFYGGNCWGLSHWSVLTRFQHIDVGLPTTGVTTQVCNGHSTAVLHYWSFNGTEYPFPDQRNPTAPSLSIQDLGDSSTVDAIGTVMTNIDALTKTHLSFDGHDDRVQFNLAGRDLAPDDKSHCIAVGPEAGFTIEAIFRHRDRRSWARVFDFRDSGATDGSCGAAESWEKPGFALKRGDANGTNKLALSVFGSDCEKHTGTWNHDFETKLNVWHRAIVTGGPTGWSLWIDGDLLAEGSAAMGTSADLFPETTQLCTGAAGAMYQGGSAHRGEISVLRIWPRQFTESQVLRQYTFEGAAAIAEPTHNWEFADAFGQNLRDFGSTPSNGTLMGNPIWFDAESVLRESEGCSLCVHATPPASGAQTAYFSQNYGDVIGSCYDCNGTAQGPARWLTCGCEREIGVCGCDADDACTDCDGVPYGANCGCARQHQCRVDVLVCADDLRSYTAMRTQYDFDQFAGIVDFESLHDRMLGGSAVFDPDHLTATLSFMPTSLYNPDGTQFNQSAAQLGAMDMMAEYMNSVNGQFAYSKSDSCPTPPNHPNHKGTGGNPAGGSAGSSSGSGALGGILAVVITTGVVITGGYVYVKYVRSGGGAKSASTYGKLSVNADNDDGDFDGDNLATAESDDDDVLIDEEIMA